MEHRTTALHGLEDWIASLEPGSRQLASSTRDARTAISAISVSETARVYHAR